CNVGHRSSYEATGGAGAPTARAHLRSARPVSRLRPLPGPVDRHQRIQGRSRSVPDGSGPLLVPPAADAQALQATPVAKPVFPASLYNSGLLAACVVVITLLTAVPAGYALARLRLPGAESLGICMFLTYLVPSIVLFIPLARVVGSLGLFDSWWALALVYPTFTIPFCTWLLMGFFKALPGELEE